MKKKLQNYVSEADHFLKKYDQEHPQLSPSQLKEIKKSQRVSELRDHPKNADNNSKIWEEF